MSPLIRLAAALIATPYFLRKHVDEETRGFATDIDRKLALRVINNTISRAGIRAAADR